MAEDGLIKIFVSSPSDVRPERLVAQRIIERLNREFSAHFRVEPLLWERQPLRATDHFQTMITPPSTTDLTVVIVWARLGTPLPADQFTGPLSSGPVTGTQWEFEDAYKGFRMNGAPELLVYRKTGDVEVALSDEAQVEESLRQKRLVSDFIKYWFGGDSAGPLKAAFREFATTPEFEDMLETHLREALRRRIRRGVALGSEVRWHQGSPYRGLTAFEPEHAAVFFGRTKARHELRELLTRQAERGCGFVLVFGASGSGKSSLVRAGLIPDLLVPGMAPGIGLCRYCIMKPSDLAASGLTALADRLLAPTALPELSEVSAAGDWLSPERIVPTLQSALDRAATVAKLTDQASARLIVVVDQLEELFTLEALGAETRAAFVSVLSALARSGLAWVVATMRSDFFERLVDYPELARLTQGEARYLLVPPDEFELDQMIQRPAREAGTRFDVDIDSGVALDEEIRNSASRHPGSLPLLGFVLDQLWQQRTPEGALTWATYRTLGGLEGALAKRAEEEFTELEPEVQRALPETLRLLATVEEGDQGRTLARLAPLAMFAPGSPRRWLIDAFAAPKARLLILEADGGRGKVRVAHEALLTRWPRAAEELRTAHRDLQLRARLDSDAAQYREGGRTSDLLLRAGLRLSEAEDILDRRESELDAETIDFIKASAVAVRAAQRARERRRLMLAVGVVAVLAIFAGGGWYALSLRSGARATERARQLETAKAEVVEDNIQPAVDRLAGVLQADPAAEPVFGQAYAHWSPALDPLANVLGNLKAYEPFTWHGHTYVVDGDTHLHELPSPLLLSGLSRDHRHLLTVHPGNRIIEWQLPDLTPEVAVQLGAQFSADFIVNGVFEIQGHLVLEGRIAALFAGGQTPFVIVFDPQRHKAIPIELAWKTQVDQDCTVLRIQDRGDLFRMQPIALDADGTLTKASADLGSSGREWKPFLDDGDLVHQACAAALVSQPTDGAPQKLTEIAFPRLKPEATFWSAVPPVRAAGPPARHSPPKPLDLGKVHVVTLPSEPASGALVGTKSSADEEAPGFDHNPDAIETDGQLDVQGTKVLKAVVLDNHGIVERLLCRVRDGGGADRCVHVVLTNGGGDVLPLAGTSLAVISGNQTASERSLWVVDLVAMDDRSPDATPDGDGPAASHVATTRRADRLAVAAVDGALWVYRRDKPSARFTLGTRIALPGVRGRTAGPTAEEEAAAERAAHASDQAEATPASKTRPTETKLVAAVAFAGATELVVARTDGQLWAFDADTGNVLWQTRLGLPEPAAALAVSLDDTAIAVSGATTTRLVAAANGMPLSQPYVVPHGKGAKPPARLSAGFQPDGTPTVSIGDVTYRRAAPKTDDVVQKLRAQAPPARDGHEPAARRDLLPGTAEVPRVDYKATALQPEAAGEAGDAAAPVPATKLLDGILPPGFKAANDNNWDSYDLDGDGRPEIIVFGTRPTSDGEREEYIGVVKILNGNGGFEKVADSLLTSRRDSGIGITEPRPADLDHDGTKEIIVWLGSEGRKSIDGVFAVDFAHHQLRLLQRRDAGRNVGAALFDSGEFGTCAGRACPGGTNWMSIDNYVADADHDGTPDFVHTIRKEVGGRSDCTLEVYKKEGEILEYAGEQSKTIAVPNGVTCEWALKTRTK